MGGAILQRANAADPVFPNPADPVMVGYPGVLGLPILPADGIRHEGIVVSCEEIQEKTVSLYLQETCAGGMTQYPGVLWVWIEISNATANYWDFGAIGGGGGWTGLATGYRAPSSPTVITAERVVDGPSMRTVHLSWTMHSSWMKVCVQQMTAGIGPNSSWYVIGYYQGKTP